MDFSRYKPSNLYYGGSERKQGIVINGREYMLKFQKKTAFGLRYNHISEHIGSRIFAMLGFETQETYLGSYRGEAVVACRNFIGENEQFVPFNEIGESTLEQDKEQYQYTYEDIMQMLRDNSKLTNVNATVELFWEMFVVDAFLGNFDRHGSNWGFLKQNNQYRLAPVFDNGSCLFPNMTDEEEMRSIMGSAQETEKRVYTFPTSQIKLKGRKSSYYEVIHSLAFPECNKALKRIYVKIDMRDIYAFIDEIEGITEVHRAFYKHMLNARYEKIIKESYRLLEEKEKCRKGET